MKRIQAGRREGEMTQITSYSMDAFIDDARKTFVDSDDARVQAYSIAKYMEICWNIRKYGENGTNY